MKYFASASLIRRNSLPLPQWLAIYSAIPASSAPVEGIFSTAGHLFNKKRSKMSAETLEVLLTLHSWTRYDFF